MTPNVKEQTRTPAQRLSRALMHPDDVAFNARRPLAAVFRGELMNLQRPHDQDRRYFIVRLCARPRGGVFTPESSRHKCAGVPP